MRGFGRLLLAQATRDRWVLPIWILGIGALQLVVAAAIVTQFSAEADRAGLVAIAVVNPAFLFLRGLPDGTSTGAVAFFSAFAFTGVLTALMSTFLVVRHTRADEELGRAELIGATPVGRATPLAATLALGVIANVALVGVAAVASIVGGLPAEGSVVAALAAGGVGVTFVAIAAVVAQLLPDGRAANGVAGAIVGAAYLVRGIGDALGTPSNDLQHVTPSALSWLSPIGWGQATRPFSEPTLLPLLLCLGAAIVLGAAAIALRTRRDLGASLVADRSGRAKAGRGGRTVLGLAWRLQRGTLLGWTAGGLVLGAIAGGLAPVVAAAMEDNDSLAQLIARLVPDSDAGSVDVFVSGILGIAGVLAAGAGVQAVLRLRAEEAEGRAELLLATPLARLRWMGATVVVAVASVVTVCLATGVAAGSAIVKSGGDADALGRLAGAGLAHAPAALTFVALTAVLFAVIPRLAITLGWGLLALGLVLGEFGELLGLPDWVQGLSPFHWSSALPVEELDVGAAAILLAIAAAGCGLAALGVRQRDLVA